LADAIDFAPAHAVATVEPTRVLATPPNGGEPLTLSLGDLLPDAGSEVVLSGFEGMALTLMADAPVASKGIADGGHITAAGVDVTGQSFLAFESGVTVYFPTGTDFEIIG